MALRISVNPKVWKLHLEGNFYYINGIQVFFLGKFIEIRMTAVSVCVYSPPVGY